MAPGKGAKQACMHRHGPLKRVGRPVVPGKGTDEKHVKTNIHACMPRNATLSPRTRTISPGLQGLHCDACHYDRPPQVGPGDRKALCTTMACQLRHSEGADRAGRRACPRSPLVVSRADSWLATTGGGRACAPVEASRCDAMAPARRGGRPSVPLGTMSWAVA